MSTLAAIHDAHGVRWSEDGAARLPRNYGDPAAEYATARSDVVVAERGDRSFVRVHGRDPVKMIQGLISNDIANAPVGRAVYAAVLTPKGKMVADVRVLRQGADLLLETDAAAADAVMTHLRKFVPPLFARFENASDAWTELGVYGPNAVTLLKRVLDVDLSNAAEDDVLETSMGGTSICIAATARFDVPGFDIIVPAQAAAQLWESLVAEGARPAGHATLDVLRIEAGTPRWGAELDENTIPLEAGLRERAISETKGCYTGQEVIIRILHRGHVNWLLRGILLGDAAAPARATPLLAPGDARKVGRITSAAWSPKHGQTIALGYVRREVEPGAELTLDSATGRVARVVALPFPAPADLAPDV